MAQYRHSVFHDVKDFPSLKILEDNWEVLLGEYKKVTEKLIKWPEKNLHNGKWEAYGILFKGEYLDNACPRTTQIVKSIPGAYIAGFSILKAGCVIYPHTGYTTEVLRTHLGLICPQDCWIKVNDETYTWTEGQVVTFDDTMLHEASNESDVDRVVFILDIKKE
jgi:ornithine lipid ester-linked acyl 2-hydroxylase